MHPIYDWLVRRRMPLTYLHEIARYGISWLPNGKLKDNCEWALQRALFFVKTTNIKVVSNLGKCPNYTVFEIDSFLSPEECDRIVQIAKEKGVVDSTIIDDRGTRVLDLFTRKSKQTWLKDADDPMVAQVSQWVADITDLPVAHQEDLQVVSYPEGGYYNAHFDASFHPDVIPNMNRGCGPRLYTFLIYLNDDFEGGETDFPEAGVCVKPKKGKAILFQNIDNHQDLIPESMHAGCPVVNGTKWIANKWIRIWPFELATIANSLSAHNDKTKVYPRSLEMMKYNLYAYNSPCIKKQKLDQVDIIEMEGTCDVTDMNDADAHLTQVLAQVLPIPMNDKALHITSMRRLVDDCADVYGLPIIRLYLFTEDDGVIEFPYLKKVIECRKGKVVVVFTLDDTLLYNVAAVHRLTCDPSYVYTKSAMTLPTTFQTALDDPRAFVDRVRSCRCLDVDLKECKQENTQRIVYGYHR